MKYIQSRKFRALGIVLASAVAVATATPSFATPHAYVSDTTGSMTDPTGPGTDTTGPTDTSGHSLDPDVKKEMHYSLNSHQTAACKTIILQLRADFKAARASGKLDTFYRVTLPAAKLAYFAIAKPTDTTGPGAGHATSLTGLKNELKGKHADHSPW
jgi:hypothetical protein